MYEVTCQTDDGVLCADSNHFVIFGHKLALTTHLGVDFTSWTVSDTPSSRNFSKIKVTSLRVHQSHKPTRSK